MTNQNTTIHQSGERVRVAGTYEVVGIPQRSAAKRNSLTEGSVRFLCKDDLFPCHDGRDVCWRLLSSDVDRVRITAEH